MNFIGIIPARFESSRFPGKPLAIIQNKPMIAHVYQNAKKSNSLHSLVVATDHPQIVETVTQYGGQVIMTGSHHKTGTDRVFEAVKMLGCQSDSTVVINIQGDEPFIDPQLIDVVCGLFENKEVQIATAFTHFPDKDDLFSPNSIKVTVDCNGKALYFSRSVIPFNRNAESDEWLALNDYKKHIGIYAYRMNILELLTQLPQSSLELCESLEQLRWIENGFSIHTVKYLYEAHSVDVPEDILKLPIQ